MTDSQLGHKYRDTITGFVGTATARTVYLDSSVQVRLEAETGNEDAKERWIDESRLEQIDKHGVGFGGDK